MNALYKKNHKRFQCYLNLTPELKSDGTVLLDRPGVCRCEIRKIGNNESLRQWEEQQNYAGRRDGSDLAVEAELYLESEEHPDWNHLRIGVPLSELMDVNELILQYTGPAFQLLANGRILDEELPFGDPPGNFNAETFEPVPEQVAQVQEGTIFHTWSPDGLNAWVGDVSVGYFNGEFHIFYLYDRRHHQSKFQRGGHQWAHLTTRDFRRWRNDGLILPFTEQWQTFGTGTPFELNGNIALAYGLHTSRLLPDGTAPRGGTWAESSDGIHYIPKNRVFTHAENPSVYHRPGGGFLLFCGHCSGGLQLQEADLWPEFRPVNDRIAPSGEQSLMKNCLDCPAWFEWHEKHYILVGFTGMWSADSYDFSSGKIDLAAQGKDFYDGLAVPMVASYRDNRRILAGWLPINGFGGVLGLRELVHFPDGIPGIKFLDEAMPVFPKKRSGADEDSVQSNCLIELELPAGESIKLRFDGEGEAVEFRLDAARKRAELTFASLPEYPTTREAVQHNLPRPAGFAVEQLRKTEQNFRIRIMVRQERKWNGSIIDVEIAGCRTLIAYFKEVKVNHYTLSGNAYNLQIEEAFP